MVVGDGGLDGVLGEHGAVDCRAGGRLSAGAHGISRRGVVQRARGFQLTLDGREAELLGNVDVADLGSIIHCVTGYVSIVGQARMRCERRSPPAGTMERLLTSHALDERRQVAGAGDGRTAAERLELGIGDGARLLVDLDLELHDVAAGGRADEARPDGRVLLVHGPGIPRPAVVINECCACQPGRPPFAVRATMGGSWVRDISLSW